MPRYNNLTLQVTPYDVSDGANTLLRIHHIMAVDEDPELSQSVTIDLQSLFVDWVIDSCVEVTASGGHDLSVSDSADEILVTIDPMDIRTFAITMHQA